MVARQKGRCALCRRRPIERLQFDHSHDAQKLRLLLCLGCNTGFGSFGDDPGLMRAAADYLDIWPINHSSPGPNAIKTMATKNAKPTQKGQPPPRRHHTA